MKESDVWTSGASRLLYAPPVGTLRIIRTVKLVGYSIHWLVFFCNHDGKCLLRGTDWLLNKTDYVSSLNGSEPRIINKCVTFDRVSVRILAIRTDTEIFVQGNVLSDCRWCCSIRCMSARNVLSDWFIHSLIHCERCCSVRYNVCKKWTPSGFRCTQNLQEPICKAGVWCRSFCWWCMLQ